ncbi:MAG: DsbA family protein [Sulfurifustis sp.]
MSEQRVLWYFADPMCSWCWGFAPVIDAINETYRERIALALVMGGLRAGTTEPVTPAFRADIQHHWEEVQRRTGQPFRFDGALPDGFVYDTEPACRAVVVMEELMPEAKFGYFKSVQAAFYAEGRDVTQPATLASLAAAQGLEERRFLEHFEADYIKRKTFQHFEQTQQAGIRGFPTAVLQDERGFALLTYGYAPLADLQPKIDDWLRQ